MPSKSQARKIKERQQKYQKQTTAPGSVQECEAFQRQERKSEKDSSEDLDELLSHRAKIQSEKLVRNILSMSNKHAKETISDEEARCLRANRSFFQPFLSLIYRDIVANHLSTGWDPSTPDKKQSHLFPEFNSETVDFILANPDELSSLFQWLESFIQLIPDLIAHNFDKIRRAETIPNGVYSDAMFRRTEDLYRNGMKVGAACEQTLKEFNLAHRSVEGYRKMYNKRLKK